MKKVLFLAGNGVMETVISALTKIGMEVYPIIIDAKNYDNSISTEAAFRRNIMDILASDAKVVVVSSGLDECISKVLEYSGFEVMYDLNILEAAGRLKKFVDA